MRQVITAFFLALPLTFATAEFSGPDYSDAMRMAVKFFGGQRCGNTHNWMLYENDSKNGDVCHTKDAYNGNDLSGGWHDCGDHFKVATTMGYSAIGLLTAYDCWPKAFEDDHDPEYKPGANGIPDVLDEVKIATDYFMKCLINGTTFVYWVGDAHDHDKWVTSEYQSTLGAANGGDPRPVSTTSTAGGLQAADYASALALMARLYPDQVYAEKCKTAAIAFYNYAKAHPTTIIIPSFYNPVDGQENQKVDELSLAAILLYNLTKTESYKTEAIARFKALWESNSALSWDNKSAFAYYYIIKADPSANNGDTTGGTLKFHLKKDVFKAMSGVNSYGIPWGWSSFQTWGSNRCACGSAYSAALYAKLIEDGVITAVDGLAATTANDYAKKIINYMLGENEIKHPYLHGYKNDTYCKIHHRNAMGRDDNPTQAVKNSSAFKFKSGGLIGGPMSSAGTFSNIVEGGDAFMETEGGCDYNASFIGPLAALVSKLDPKNSASIKMHGFSNRNYTANVSTLLKSQSVMVVDIRGRKVDQSLLLNNSVNAQGIYFIQDKNAARTMKKINFN
jgi:endoglucanase